MHERTTKGIVHWRDSGLRAFVLQFFLSCKLIRLSYEIANETMHKPLCATQDTYHNDTE